MTEKWFKALNSHDFLLYYKRIDIYYCIILVCYYFREISATHEKMSKQQQNGKKYGIIFKVIIALVFSIILYDLVAQLALMR